jgi:multicomponent Na+:H+ antiporter subunit G
MTVAQWSIDVLLAIGVIVALAGCIGIAVVKDFYERLHYLAPPSTISITCFAAAVLIDKRLSQAGIKALLIWGVVVWMNAVLTHATARAARIRQFGRWLADVTQVRGLEDDSTAGLNTAPEVDSTDDPGYWRKVS